MPRKPKGQHKEYDRPGLEEDLDLDHDEEEIDPEVKDIFEEAQELDFGRRDLERKLQTYTDRTPELTGGDLDASWEYADIGEEAVGGQNPTPDQSVVDEEGEALGITYNDNEPLRTTDKLQERDRNPWELNPASSPDFSERVKEEFNAPLEAVVRDAPARTASPSGQQEKPRANRAKALAAKNANRPAKTNAASSTKARAAQRTGVSRKTDSNRATNAARGIPAHVRSKTVTGKRRNTSTHKK